VSLIVRTFATGGDRNFGYLAADGERRRAALIDPSPDPGEILDTLRREELVADYVFVTHGHADHTGGSLRAAKAVGTSPLVFGDTDSRTGRKIGHGTRLPLGGLEVTVLHTPGHTADSICLLVGDALFTGDTLFAGKVGGTDLGNGARAQYDSLHRVLLALPDDTVIYPGHDYGADRESTIGRERRSNPFLLQPGLDAFVDLKRNWAAYKEAHGIT